MITKYAIAPATGTDDHHAPAYLCAVHCACPDHYYRMRDCKHIRAWLLAYDAMRENGQRWQLAVTF